MSQVTQLNELGLHSLAESMLKAIGRLKESTAAFDKAQQALREADENLQAIKRKLMEQASAKGATLNIVVMDGAGFVRAEPVPAGYTVDTAPPRVTVEALTLMKVPDSPKKWPKSS
jgi:hypothetical protein